MITFITINDPDEAFELLSSTRWVYPLNGYYMRVFTPAKYTDAVQTSGREHDERVWAGQWLCLPQDYGIKVMYPAKANCGFWIGSATELIESARVQQTYWPIRMFVSDQKPDWFLKYVFPVWAVLRFYMLPKPKTKREDGPWIFN
jgi:hypothetical protein